MLLGRDVAQDGSTVLAGDEQLTVPIEAQRSLRAQHIVRTMFGHGPDDEFLLDGARNELRDVTGTLNRLTRTLGIPLRRAHDISNQSPRWQYRRGVSIRSLNP